MLKSLLRFMCISATAISHLEIVQVPCFHTEPNPTEHTSNGASSPDHSTTTFTVPSGSESLDSMERTTSTQSTAIDTDKAALELEHDILEAELLALRSQLQQVNQRNDNLQDSVNTLNSHLENEQRFYKDLKQQVQEVLGENDRLRTELKRVSRKSLAAEHRSQLAADDANKYTDLQKQDIDILHEIIYTQRAELHRRGLKPEDRKFKANIRDLELSLWWTLQEDRQHPQFSPARSRSLSPKRSKRKSRTLSPEITAEPRGSLLSLRKHHENRRREQVKPEVIRDRHGYEDFEDPYMVERPATPTPPETFDV